MLDMIYLVLHVILFHMCSMSMNIHGSVFISLAYCCRFHNGGEVATIGFWESWKDTGEQKGAD